MMKRLIDVVVSIAGLIMFSPFLLIAMLFIWLQDFHSPFYVAERVGKDNRGFAMIKLRSMIVNADKSKVDSTSSNDPRITLIGRLVRRYKLDELPQLWNVLKGDMSLVGPRPNVKRETELYTVMEKKILCVKPGITDISSIVFSDESEILKDSKDPDIDYNQLIRPWKSRLGLLYVEKKTIWLDIIIILLTILAIFSRKKALQGVNKLLIFINTPEDIIRAAKRENPLAPAPPPGATSIVTNRKVL